MADKNDQKHLKVIEFYSGIGGMHCSLKACVLPTHVVAAIDINTTANEVYCHNFPDTLLLNRNIEGIKLDAFIKFDADVFMMSPPCQPFTRQGHQRASCDPRTNSFLYIMDILRRLPKPPTYILMENVKGFETSDTRQDFVKTLEESNYTYQEFLLTPMQFGIPNSRLRYFLIAVQKPMEFPFQTKQSIMECLPSVSLHQDSQRRCTQNKDNPRSHCTICSNTTFQETRRKTNRSTCNESKDKSCGNCFPNNLNKPSLENILNDSPMTDQCSERSNGNKVALEEDTKCEETVQRCIKDFLDVDENSSTEFLLPDNILKTKVLLMDIVQEGCNHSCCFTKGYGHYVEGSGSVLQGNNVNSCDIFSQYNEVVEEDRANLLKPLLLRYFTPREISNLQCFPKDFDFPKTISTKQKYRLLGNSLNVLVVTKLANILFLSSVP